MNEGIDKADVILDLDAIATENIEKKLSNRKKRLETSGKTSQGKTQLPMSFDYETSQRIAKIIDSQPHDCWNNAFKALPYLQKGYYVEGWLMCDGIIFEHGWCEFNESVIDPTLYNCLGKNYLYYPGVKYDFKEVFSFLKKERNHLPIVRITIGIENKSYLEARNQAFHACNF